MTFEANTLEEKRLLEQETLETVLSNCIILQGRKMKP